MMAVEKFVSKTLELLQEEREAEIEETRYVKKKDCDIILYNEVIQQKVVQTFLLCLEVWKIRI